MPFRKGQVPGEPPKDQTWDCSRRQTTTRARGHEGLSVPPSGWDVEPACGPREGPCTLVHDSLQGRPGHPTAGG